MAAAVRNNVWVAPGQDAQFLYKTTAPLTADGLRGEDHGQVLCNTRDAISGTCSFHDYNLVGECIFLLHLPQGITLFTGACCMLRIRAKQAVFIHRCTPNIRGRPICLLVIIFTATVPTRDRNLLWMSVLMLTFTD